MKKVVFVTGGNRGIGFGLCSAFGEKGYQVVLAARKAEDGQQATESLKSKGHSITFVPLDINDEKSISKALLFVEQEFGRLDILINNAGILVDRNGKPSKKILLDTFETNAVGPYLMCEAAGELMKKSGGGRIVNVSSQAGQLENMHSEFPAYRISKAALNAVTKVFSTKYKPYGILVNSVCPGWVKTEMGGPGAQISVEEGVDTIVWAAELPADGPTGSFFHKRSKIAW